MSHATPPAPRPGRLSDLPLWRLLVALHDAEFAAGPDSPTARVLARAIRERLRRRRPGRPAGREGDPHADLLRDLAGRKAELRALLGQPAGGPPEPGAWDTGLLRLIEADLGLWAGSLRWIDPPRAGGRR